MKCLTCESIAVADCLCVPCGAKAWVANARLANKTETLSALDEHNPFDAERLKARAEIKTIGEARAFEHNLVTARNAMVKQNAAIEKPRCPACAGSGFVASDEPYMMMQAVPCGWCQ